MLEKQKAIVLTEEQVNEEVCRIQKLIETYKKKIKNRY